MFTPNVSADRELSVLAQYQSCRPLCVEYVLNFHRVSYSDLVADSRGFIGQADMFGVYLIVSRCQESGCLCPQSFGEKRACNLTL